MAIYAQSPRTSSCRPLLVPSLLALACGLSALSASAQQTGREMGRVISSIPVMQQVAVPRQYCGTEEVYVPGEKSGAGAVIGDHLQVGMGAALKSDADCIDHGSQRQGGGERGDGAVKAEEAHAGGLQGRQRNPRDIGPATQSGRISTPARPPSRALFCD